MLTKRDLQLIGKIVDVKLEQKLEEKLKIWTRYLVKEMIEMFNTTNERIDKTNIRIDKVLMVVENHHGRLNDQERRIERLEDNTFS